MCPNLAQEEEKLRQTTLELGLYLHVSFVKRREAMWNPLSFLDDAECQGDEFHELRPRLHKGLECSFRDLSLKDP